MASTLRSATILEVEAKPLVGWMRWLDEDRHPSRVESLAPKVCRNSPVGVDYVGNVWRLSKCLKRSLIKGTYLRWYV